MTPQAQNILDKYSDYFESSNIIGDSLRWIGWKICIGLKIFCDLIQKLFDAAYELVAFANDNIFKTFLGNFYSLAMAIFLISFIILGLTYMFSEKRPDIIKNMLIGMAVIFIGPQVTGLLNNAVLLGKNAMVSNTSVSSQAISSNVKDLKYIAFNSFNFDLNVSEPTSNNLMYISMDEHVKPDSMSGDLQKNVFSYRKQISDSGTLEYKEVGKKGMGDIFDPPYYYRYSYHFLQIILVLLANIIIISFSAYAVVRMIWEILTTRMLASIFSMEITSGQKVKKCIESFLHSYLVLFLIAVNIKLFQLAQQFVNNKFPNWEQGLIRSILIIFIALVVIDGPRFIEQLLGYDLGISQGAQKLFGLMRIVQQSQMQHKLSNKSEQKNKNANTSESNPKFDTNSNSSSQKRSEPDVGNKNSSTDREEPGSNNSGADREEPGSNTSGTDRKEPGSNTSGAGRKEPGSNTSGAGKKEPGSNTSGAAKKEPGSNTSGAAKKEPGSNTSGAAKKEPGSNTSGAAKKEPGNNTSGADKKEPGSNTSGAAKKEPGNNTSGADKKEPGNNTSGADKKEPGNNTSGADKKEPGNNTSGADKKEPGSNTSGAGKKEPGNNTSGADKKEPGNNTSGAGKKEPGSNTSGTDKKEPGNNTSGASKKESGSNTYETGKNNNVFQSAKSSSDSRSSDSTAQPMANKQWSTRSTKIRNKEDKK